MSRSKNAGFVPSYRLHKPSGQARVIIDGEHIYLGLYGSPESHERYARLIAERVVSQNGHATDYLFSPREGEAATNTERRRNRKTPMTPSHARRKPKKHSKRAKRDRYDTYSYRRAITYGIEQANKKRKEQDQPQVPDWCPLQIRHSKATEVRKQHGLEAAQVALGHKNANITEVYAERNLALAIEIARACG